MEIHAQILSKENYINHSGSSLLVLSFTNFHPAILYKRPWKERAFEGQRLMHRQQEMQILLSVNKGLVLSIAPVGH